MRVWMVTGATRGLGQAVARRILDQGDSVAATGRNLDAIRRGLGDHPRLLPIRLDVTDPEEVQRAVRTAYDHFGRIDVLVNNAGRGLLGAIEETSHCEVAETFDVNVFGTLNMIREVLPYMRQQSAGTIVNMGSIGGLSAGAALGIYCATKFALEGLTEALYAEVKGFGISVVIAELGEFRTDFFAASSLQRAARTLPEYEATPVGQVRAWAQMPDHDYAGNPAKAAEAVYEVATMEDPPVRLLIGNDAVLTFERKLIQHSEWLAQWREFGQKASDVQPPSADFAHA